MGSAVCQARRSQSEGGKGKCQKKYQDIFLGYKRKNGRDRKRETERCRVEERHGKGERDLEEKIPKDLRQRKNKRKLECQSDEVK